MDNDKDFGASAPQSDRNSHSDKTDWHVSQENIDRAKLDNAIHDQASHSLFMDSLPANLRPKLTGDQGVPAAEPSRESQPAIKPELADSHYKQEEQSEEARRDLRDQDHPGPLKGSPGYRPADLFVVSKEHFIDNAEDLVFPGFGRFQSKHPGEPWRFDYLYSSRCKNTNVGLCFSMKLQ